MIPKGKYDLDNPSTVSMLDELSLWSAPFGMKLLDSISYKKSVRALDIGSGLGFPLVELSMRLGASSKVYGIDPWRTGIERAKRKLEIARISNVDIVEGRSESMPFENDFFDLIVSNNGLNNVQNLHQTLLECNRVAKVEAEFAFTFNTEDSFSEFYKVFRLVVSENGLGELNKKISDHIYSKRKPVSEFEHELKATGFDVKSIWRDSFNYHFSDGTSFFNHFFIKLAFLDSWLQIVPADKRVFVFGLIEEHINRIAARQNGFTTKVPFVMMSCVKKKHVTC